MDRTLREHLKRLAKAIQQNFDTLLGTVNANAAEANRLADDVAELQEYWGVEKDPDGSTIEITGGGHAVSDHDELEGVTANQHHNQSHDQTDHNAAESGDLSSIDIGDSASAGSSTEVPNADHQHAFPAPASGYPVDVADTESDGTATTPARSDHGHAHGTGYAGGHTDIASHDHSDAANGDDVLLPAVLDTLSGVVETDFELDGRLLLQGRGTNPSISSNTNDFWVTGLDIELLIDFVVSADCDLTGLNALNGTRPENGHVMFIQSDETSTNDLTLKHQSASSSANYRFELGGSDVVLSPGQVAFLRYTRQGAGGKWFLISYSGATSGGGGVTDHGALTGLGDDDHPQYALDTDLTTHAGAADPHTGYVLESLLDAKGDLIAASADNTPAKVTVGSDGKILKADSGASAGVSWDSISNLLATTTTTRKWFVTPGEGTTDDASQVTTGTSSPDLAEIWAFADAAQQGVFFNTAVPHDWASGTVEVFIWWWSGTSTGNVRWLLSVSELATGDSIGEASDKLSSSASVIADSTTIKRSSLGTFTPSAAGDLLKVNLERNGSAGTDTATGAARVAAVEFVYTATAVTAAGVATDISTAALWDAKGDLAVGTGADAASRLGVGSDKTVLTADSGETTGLKWARPTSVDGGTVDDTFPLGFDSAKLHWTAAQTIASGTGLVKLTAATAEDWDTAGVSYSSGDITLPSAGYYLVIAAVKFAANTTGRRGIAVRKNATTIVARDGIDAPPTDEGLVQTVAYGWWGAGSTLDVAVYQNSGGNLDTVVTDTWVAILRIDTRSQAKAYKATTFAGTATATSIGVNRFAFNPAGYFNFSGALAAAEGTGLGVNGIVPKGGGWFLHLGYALGGTAVDHAIGLNAPGNIGLAWGHTNWGGADGVTALAAALVRDIAAVSALDLFFNTRTGSDTVAAGEDGNYVGGIWLGSRRSCALFTNSNSTGIADSTVTKLLFDEGYIAQTEDPDHMYTNSSGDISVPRTGKYLAVATWRSTHNAASRTRLQIRYNGTEVGASQYSTLTSAVNDRSMAYAVFDVTNTGQTIDVRVFQNSGGTSTEAATVQVLFLMRIGD